jgi:drug/metabolite transporter (DMT)-like permease
MPEVHHSGGLRTAALTALAMLAFAANSLLCRIALAHGAIDAASFAGVRMLSGAVMLGVVLRLSLGAGSVRAALRAADGVAVAMLLAYVVFFTAAYLALAAGTGALILFGAVQVTMLAAGLRAGESFSAAAWLGFALAIAGLAYLVSPGVSAPPFMAAASMAMAGVAWGVYSLRGRKGSDALPSTAANFALAAPLTVLLGLPFAAQAHASPQGIALAAVSGAITSGLGYVVWYAALRGLSAMRAATVQLSVPLIAAVGGVAFLAEPVTARLAGASVAILGGIAMVLAAKSRRAHAALNPGRASSSPRRTGR